MTPISATPIGGAPLPAYSGYHLSDAVTHLASLPWLSRAVENELVEGYFDGVNRSFRVASPPIYDATQLVVRDPAGVTAFVVSAVQAATGAFTLSPAPSGPVTASYTACLLSEAKLQWACQQGLDDMEGLWRRGYSYFPDGADYVLSSTPASFTAPLAGALTFQQSRAQVGFYQACCEVALLRALAQEAAHNSINYREERVGGLSVDATRRARDFAALLEQAEKSLAIKEQQARFEVGDAGEFGYFLPGPRQVDGVWYGLGEGA